MEIEWMGIAEMDTAPDIAQSGTSSDVNVVQESEQDNVSLFIHFEDKLKDEKNKRSTNISFPLCINQYSIEMPHLGRNDNPLDVWAQHEQTMP